MRRQSLGKTLLSGGIPMTKKVTRQEEVQTEERERMLFVAAGELPLLVFRQNGMNYDGFGPAVDPDANLDLAAAILARCLAGAMHDES